MIPQSTITDVLDRLDLPGFVGEAIHLERKGGSYEGLCPFHAEGTPSFKVFADHYHCFGCGAHGNALRFAMENHGLSFPDAVKMLAGRVGVRLPDEPPSENEVFAREEREALRYACARFSQALHEERGREAMAELLKRGVDEETVVRFGLGFAPDEWGFLSDDRKVRRDALLSAGLAISRKEGKKGCYDFFRGRLMFPVREPGGDVVGFGARRLGDEGAKYINSPDTPVYQKGRVLFGWPQAAAAIRQSRSVIVCEGFFDVIIPSQAGIENIVSTCGTALTQPQAEFLLAAADKIVFCFDGDAAGAKASWRAAELLLPLLADHHTISLCRLPDGHDPDSLVREKGSKALGDAIAAAPTLCEYLIGEVARATRIPEAKARAFSKAVSLEDAITSPVLGAFFRQTASAALGISDAEFMQLARPTTAPRDVRVCPCCASEASLNDADGGFSVSCQKCGISTPTLDSSAAALSIWNRRERPILSCRPKNEEKDSSRVHRGDARAIGA